MKNQLENYAGVKEVDDNCKRELDFAGISYKVMPSISTGEVPTKVFGFIDEAGWIFERAWNYWVATGPGIPPLIAEELHEKHGTFVRVAGHCGSPSPLEWYKGFGVGNYHVDTLDGLKALADTIKSVLIERK